VAALAVGLVLSGCTTWADPIPPRAASGSLQQVWVTGLDPGDPVRLLPSADGAAVATGTADANGTYVFYGLTQQPDYWVQVAGHPLYDTPKQVLPVRSAMEQPTPSDYDQWVADGHRDPARPLLSTQLAAGTITATGSGGPTFGYLPARDSTALAVAVAVPPGTCTTAGQTGCVRRPTVVVHTPYGSASALHKPADRFHPPAAADEASLGGLDIARDAREFTKRGYAFVAVDVRGTWCSGGAYESSGGLVASDAFDAVEIAARQPWSTGSVALHGFSGPGLMAIAGAAMHPPHLAALEVGGIGDAFEAVRPGGIGAFGVVDRNGPGTQLQQVQADGSTPPDTGGSANLVSTSWEIFQVIETNTGPWPTDPAVTARNLPIPGPEKAGYVQSCIDNQALHAQRSPARTASGQRAHIDRTVLEAARSAHRVRGGLDLPFPQQLPLDLGELVRVPTFTTGTWRDSAIPDAGDAALQFPAAPTTWAYLTNGYHDQVWYDGPGAEHRWRFLRLHLARMPASWNGSTQATLHGATPPSGWDGERAGADALPVAIAWGTPNGDAASQTGSPVVTRHAAMPDGARAAADFGTGRLWLRTDGTMVDTAAPATDDPNAAVTYQEQPGARRRLGQWYGQAEPWPAHVSGATARFDSVPATWADGFWLAGPASVDLWVRSSQDDADLQVSLSEVRSDGTEVLLQTGWRRASLRQLDSRSTPLVPRFTDAVSEPLVPGAWTPVRVALPSVAARLLPGSKLRVSISAPGGDSVNRVFDEEPSATVQIGTGPGHASSLTISFLARTPSNDANAATLAALASAVDAHRTANALGCNPSANRYEDTRAQPCRSDAPLGAASAPSFSPGG
jgi:hypothetical protein